MNVSTEIQLKLFYQMKRIRAIEETISARYTEWKMRCPVHLSTGQEAVAAAVGLAVQKSDTAVSGHRAHAHYLGKGGDLKRMLAEIYGKETGCCKGKGGSMHLIDESVGFMGSTAIVGGTIPLGVGLGLSHKLKGSKSISIIFLGDGAVEEGVFYESVNFAVLKKLPVLFVCENNFYSVYSHFKVRQPVERKMHEVAAAIGLESHFVDGNDALAVYKMTETLVEDLRQGGRPKFMELPTYRWREHCGPNFDNDIGYRSEDEYLEWKKKDPIPKLEKILKSAGQLTDAQIKKFDVEIESEVNEAFVFADSSPFPTPEQSYIHLFEEKST